MIGRLQKNILTMRLFDDHILVASLVDDHVKSLDDKQIVERYLDLLPTFSECCSGLFQNMPFGHQDFMNEESLKPCRHAGVSDRATPNKLPLAE